MPETQTDFDFCTVEAHKLGKETECNKAQRKKGDENCPALA
jgi:hypothetical protein